MQLQGHKSPKYSEVHQLVKFNEQEESVFKAARTTDEAKELIESGFEYVCELEGIKLLGNENEKSRRYGKSAADRT